MPQELQERTATFPASNRVFSRAGVAVAQGVQRDPDSLRRPPREHVATGRLLRAPRGVCVVARDASPARFVVLDCIIAGMLRPDGMLGYRRFAPCVDDDCDCRKVAECVKILGISSVAGVVGRYLEKWQTELNGPHLTLGRLQDMIPGWKPNAVKVRASGAQPAWARGPYARNDRQFVRGRGPGD